MDSDEKPPGPENEPESGIQITKLSWIGFLCFVIANAAEAFKDLNLHDPRTIAIAIGAAGLSIGGLCLHPPWAK